MNLKYWKKQFLRATQESPLKMRYEIVSKGKEAILNRSKILIIINSSIVLEAFICNVSVITADISNDGRNLFTYYSGLPDSIVKIGNLAEEIQKNNQQKVLIQLEFIQLYATLYISGIILFY